MLIFYPTTNLLFFDIIYGTLSSGWRFIIPALFILSITFSLTGITRNENKGLAIAGLILTIFILIVGGAFVFIWARTY